MINQMKKRYVPCEIKVVKFNVEKGFAFSLIKQQNFVGTQYYWTMKMQNGHYRNEGYENKDFNWGSNEINNVNMGD